MCILYSHVVPWQARTGPFDRGPAPFQSPTTPVGSQLQALCVACKAQCVKRAARNNAATRVAYRMRPWMVFNALPQTIAHERLLCDDMGITRFDSYNTSLPRYAVTHIHCLLHYYIHCWTCIGTTLNALPSEVKMHACKPKLNLHVQVFASFEVQGPKEVKRTNIHVSMCKCVHVYVQSTMLRCAWGPEASSRSFPTHVR